MTTNSFNCCIEHICTYLTIPLSTAVALLFTDSSARSIVTVARPRVYVDDKSAIAYIQYAVRYRWRIVWIECNAPLPLLCSNMLQAAIYIEPSELISLIWIHNRCISDQLLMQCVNLKHVMLPKNRQLSDRGFINLNELETLDLTHNKRITNAALITKHKLRYITFVHNQRLTDAAFIGCKKLEYLHVGYNSNVSLTLEFIKYNTNLIELHTYNKHWLNLLWFTNLAEFKNLVAPRVNLFK